MTITAAIIERTKRFEEVVPHMYLDSKANVTIGVGFMLPSADAATEFALKTANGVASAEQKRQEWTTVHGAEHGHLATWYASLTSLTLEKPEIDRLLSDKLATFETEVAGIFADWATYPEPAREALIDMIYNLGRPGLMKYGRLIAAVRAREFGLAAGESHRDGISEDRNIEIRNLLLRAEQLSPTLAGTWRALQMIDGSSETVTIVFTHTGSNSYQGRVVGIVDGEPFDYALEQVVYTPPNRLRFLLGLAVFDGLISADVRRIDGTVSSDGNVTTMQMTRV